MSQRDGKSLLGLYAVNSLNAAVVGLEKKMASSKNIRAAVVSSSMSRIAGGLFWSVRALNQSLIRKGCDVYTYSGEDVFSHEDEFSWKDVPLKILPTVGPRSFGYQKGLKKEIDEYSPSLLHIHGLWMYPSFFSAQCFPKDKPYIVSPRGMLDPWALNNSSWKKKIAEVLYEKSSLRGASCIHALCESEFQSIRRYGLKNPVAIIPNGVDVPKADGFIPEPAWRKQIPADSKVLLFLGRLHPKKGISELLKAWGRAQSFFGAEQWDLVIAGWGGESYVRELRNQGEGLIGCGNVHFIGPQFGEEKAATLKYSDAFILPSHSEGLPMAVLEAWSYDLPVMMTDHCNLDEGFLANAAIKVDACDYSISLGLSELFNMGDEELHEIGSNGRLLVEEKFSWDRVGSQMLDVYHWVCGNADAPSCIRVD